MSSSRGAVAGPPVGRGAYTFEVRESGGAFWEWRNGWRPAAFVPVPEDATKTEKTETEKTGEKEQGAEDEDGAPPADSGTDDEAPDPSGTTPAEAGVAVADSDDDAGRDWDAPVGPRGTRPSRTAEPDSDDTGSAEPESDHEDADDGRP